MAEKYTQWADRSCGVNPFVPGDITLPKQTLSRLGYIAMSALVALPRMAIAGSLAVIYLILQVVLNEFILLLLSLGLSWLCNVGQLNPKYLLPLGVFTFINFLSVSMS
jgi:hypothetical protein